VPVPKIIKIGKFFTELFKKWHIFLRHGVFRCYNMHLSNKFFPNIFRQPILGGSCPCSSATRPLYSATPRH